MKWITKTRVTVVVAVLLLGAVLAVVALSQSDPSAFAFKWYWQNNGVGNYVADLTVVVLGARKAIKEWREHKATQQQLLASHRELAANHQTILEHLDLLHRHLKIGKHAEGVETT